MASVARKASKSVPTAKQALAQAVRLFGKNATVSHQPDALTEGEKQPFREMTPEQRKALTRDQRGALLVYRWQVGRLVDICGICMNRILGQGDTWEEALGEALNAKP